MMENIATVEDVKGHWIKRLAVDGFPKKWEYKCSKCGCVEENLNHFNFCPHCGRPMEGIRWLR